MLYPLSYEGKLPICRDFSLRPLGKGYHMLLLRCQTCRGRRGGQLEEAHELIPDAT